MCIFKTERQSELGIRPSIPINHHPVSCCDSRCRPAVSLPPLVVREILDSAIPRGDRRLIVARNRAVVSALADAALKSCNGGVRPSGRRTDRRPPHCALRKVQRLPVGFFTRPPVQLPRDSATTWWAQSALTSTAGVSREQRHRACHHLATMAALEWRLTLLSLIVLPTFIIPARRVGHRLQDISRRQMQHNATMNTQMTERFNVAGAMLVKLFGDELELNTFSTQPTQFEMQTSSAMLGRVFFVALGLVGAIGTAAIYGIGAWMVVNGSITAGTLVALAALVTGVYQPLTGLTNARVDLMTSMVSFERSSRCLMPPNQLLSGRVQSISRKRW